MNPITKKQKKQPFLFGDLIQFILTSYNSTVWDPQPNPHQNTLGTNFPGSPGSSNHLYPSTSHPLSRPNVPNPSPSETKQKTGCRWLVSKGKELGRVGWVWLGLVGFGFFETTKTKTKKLFFQKVIYSWSVDTIQQKLTWFPPQPRTPQKEEKIPSLGNVNFQGFFKRSNPQQNATHLCPLDFNGLKIPPKKRPVKSWATKKNWQIE